MVSNFVINWFKEHSAMAEDIVNHLDDNYLTNGYIDSFGFLDLIASSEEKFSIKLSDDDFANDSIFTVNGLVAVLTSRMGVQNV